MSPDAANRETPASESSAEASADAPSGVASSGSASSGSAALDARIAALEAENARLRAGAPPSTTTTGRRSRAAGPWRGILSAICIVLASVLVPVSIVAAWARVELVDESSFVATFAPLANDPHVQATIIGGVTAAIDDKVDLKGVTDDLFDGLQSLGLPPRAASALDLLRAPAAQALQALVHDAVTDLVQSDAFASTWETALRASHRALATTAAGGTSGGGLTISDRGEVGIQLGPIIDQVRQRLVDQGIGLASMIPTIDKTIVIAQSDALVTVGVVYNLAVAVGWWLPLVTLGLFLIGVLLARSRSTALLGAGLGIAIGGTSLAAGIGVGGAILGLAASRLGVSSATLGAVYGQIVADMTHTAAIVALVGAVLAVLAWANGRTRGARALRAGAGSVNAGLRRALRARGLDTGAFGVWMHAQRVLVRSALVVLLVLWLLALRPLSAGDVLLVLVVGLLVWWLAELVQKRPEEAVPVDADTAAQAAAESVAELEEAGAVGAQASVER